MEIVSLEGWFTLVEEAVLQEKVGEHLTTLACRGLTVRDELGEIFKGIMLLPVNLGVTFASNE